MTTRYRTACIGTALILAFSFSARPSNAAAAGAKEVHVYERPYRFTSDWHSRHLESWRRALAPYVGQPNLRYLEVGVFQGRSFFWVLEEVATHPTSRLTALDIDTKNISKNVALSGAAERIEMIEGRSQDALRNLPASSYDIIYIDGSHRGDDVLIDAVLSWSLLKPGGTLIFDDYMWRVNPTLMSRMTLPPELRPKEAIDTFLTLFRDQLEIVHRSFQVIVRRRDPLCDPEDRRFCSPIGSHVYDWSEKTLRDPAANRVVRLSRADREAVEALLFSLELGEARPTATQVRKSGLSEALAVQLGLEAP